MRKCHWVHYFQIFFSAQIDLSNGLRELQMHFLRVNWVQFTTTAKHVKSQQHSNSPLIQGFFSRTPNLNYNNLVLIHIALLISEKYKVDRYSNLKL